MSLSPIPVVIAPYNPKWPELAKMYSAQLSALGSVVGIVHHIGSTSVPGLAAKPIIDLMPVVSSLSELDREQSRVEMLGYAWHGELGIPERRYCTRSDEFGNRIVQLHFFSANSSHAARHLAFRDYLRAYPDERKAYEKEKQRARGLYPDDSLAYSDEKADWIRATEAKALRWLELQRAGRDG
jgi:GrpB-like predicted nucleotidyltransferase (UPF0157 family)